MGIRNKQHALATVREEFAAGGQIPSWVRAPTARSWRRCRIAGLRPDGKLGPQFAGEVDDNNALLRAALPIVKGLDQQYFGSGVAVLLADRNGRILGRWAGGAILDQLDDVSARPGFIFDEATTGTGALGTALEDESPTLVQGAEHFISRLDALCAAGAPIRHPITGRVEGAIDIVCAADVPSTFIVPLIVRAAGEVEQRLVNGHAAADRTLLDSFINVDRRGPRRPLIALNGRIVMANYLAGDLLGTGKSRHAVLWEQVQRALADGYSTIALENRDSGEVVQGVVREVSGPDGRVGALVRLQRVPAIARPLLPAPSSTREDSLTTTLARSMPGTSDIWRAVLRRVARALGTSSRVLLLGPCGVGKSALAAALLTATGPSSDGCCHDARDSYVDGVWAWIERAQKEAQHQGPLVLAHLEQLPGEGLEILTRWLDELQQTRRPIVATYRTCASGEELPAHLLAQFDHVVEIAGLEDRREDIPGIVESVLRDGDGLAVRVEPAAMRQLMSRDWPGNVRQLRRVVLEARNNCTARTIRAVDLPQEYRGRAGHKNLSRLEQAERAAIAAVIAAADGNKRTTAAQLGISRSTLYRKMAALGLES